MTKRYQKDYLVTIELRVPIEADRILKVEAPEPWPPPPQRAEKMLTDTYRECYETSLAEQVDRLNAEKDKLKTRVEELEAKLKRKKWWQFWRNCG